MSRIGEKTKIYSEVLTVTSAVGATSMTYSMSDCSQIAFIVGISTLVGATATSPTLTVVQSADKLLSTSAAVASCTGTLGIATAEQLTGCRQGVVTLGATNLTTAASITINGERLMFSSDATEISDNATVWGSSINTASAEGRTHASSNLAELINNSTLAALKGISASTPSTDSVRITLDDTNTTSTGMSLVATASTGLPLTLEKKQSIIEVKADDLAATSQYVGLQISTGDTSIEYAVTVVKSGLRFSGPQQGQHVKSPAT